MEQTLNRRLRRTGCQGTPLVAERGAGQTQRGGETPMLCSITRRGALAAMAGLVTTIRGDDAKGFRLATFSAEVTPPVGHPLLAGATVTPNAKRIDDPLFALGFVLSGGDRPVVVCAIDWCEIRNDAYDRWRDVLARAAGTTRERVLVSS